MPVALGALLYGSGYIAQFLYNYDVWQAAGGVFGTAPEFPDGNFFICVAAVFRWPYGLYGVGGCVAALAVLVFMVMRMGYSETGAYDRERNLIYSNKGTYGTAGFMTKKELKGVLDLVPNIRKHPGIILGEIDAYTGPRAPSARSISPTLPERSPTIPRLVLEERPCQARRRAEPGISHRSRGWGCRWQSKQSPVIECDSGKSVIPPAWHRRFPRIPVPLHAGSSNPIQGHRGNRRD